MAIYREVMSSPNLRVLRWLTVLGALLAVAALSLSDRAGGLIWALRAVAIRLAVGIESLSPINLPVGLDTVSGLPFASDTIGHFGAWAGIGALTAWAVRSWHGRVLAGSGLFLLSALIEVGQAMFSWSRAAERSDLAANGFGIVAGVAVGAAVLSVVRLLVVTSAWLRRTRPSFR